MHVEIRVYRQAWVKFELPHVHNPHPFVNTRNNTQAARALCLAEWPNFAPMIEAGLPSTFKLMYEGTKTRVFDPVRKKYVAFTPEEHVRQQMLRHLITDLKYPQALIAVEKTIYLGSKAKRFDIAVFDQRHQPWLLVECKAPDITLTQHTLQQLLQYHHTLQCRFWVLTNGIELMCADARNRDAIRWQASFPVYGL